MDWILLRKLLTRLCLLGPLALFFFFNLACQSLEIHIPQAQVETPEVGGKGEFTVGPSIVAAKRITILDNGGDRPPDLDEDKMENDAILAMVNGAVGLAESFEFGLQANPLGSIAAKVKYQVIGAPYMNRAEGNFSLSVFGSGMYLTSSNSGDQQEALQAGGYPWEAKISGTSLTAGASLGYRTSAHILLYGGAAFSTFGGKLELDQAESDDNSDPGGDYSKEYVALSQTATVGMRLGGLFSVFLEASVSQFQWEDEEINQSANFNAGFLFSW